MTRHASLAILVDLSICVKFGLDKSTFRIDLDMLGVCMKSAAWLDGRGYININILHNTIKGSASMNQIQIPNIITSSSIALRPT
jgi:hypothetical protein